MLENVEHVYYIRANFHGDDRQCCNKKAAKNRQEAEC